MSNHSVREQIRAIVDSVPRPAGRGKCGKDLHAAIAVALQQQTSFRVVKEDTTRFLQPQMPVWRDKHTGQIVPTAAQRKIDIVVYDREDAAALIEVESDLNDLQVSGVSTRNGQYDVFSIAHSSDGFFFDSYKSMERMAAAAMYRYLCDRDGDYPVRKECRGSFGVASV